MLRRNILNAFIILICSFLSIWNKIGFVEFDLVGLKKTNPLPPPQQTNPTKTNNEKKTPTKKNKYCKIKAPPPKNPPLMYIDQSKLIFEYSVCSDADLCAIEPNWVILSSLYYFVSTMASLYFVYQWQNVDKTLEAIKFL